MTIDQLHRLSLEQLNTYQKDGYLIMRQLFDPDELE